MARIHTHYDNLKVSRKAPQEVIRAAYKALSQKYHPDKNPGDAKAARIMAILNSAYGTLADPVRRHEHDEWIAAEDWEIEWLESTRAEEGRELLRNEAPHWEPQLIDDAVTPRLRRNPAWWLSLGLCLALGCVAGILLMSRTTAAPEAVAGLLGAKADAGVAAPPAARRGLWADGASPASPPLRSWPSLAFELSSHSTSHSSDAIHSSCSLRRTGSARTL